MLLLLLLLFLLLLPSHCGGSFLSHSGQRQDLAQLSAQVDEAIVRIRRQSEGKPVANVRAARHVVGANGGQIVLTVVIIIAVILILKSRPDGFCVRDEVRRVGAPGLLAVDVVEAVEHLPHGVDGVGNLLAQELLLQLFRRLGLAR